MRNLALKIKNASNREEINKITIPYKITERRPGDVAVCYADPTKSTHSEKDL